MFFFFKCLACLNLCEVTLITFLRPHHCIDLLKLFFLSEEELFIFYGELSTLFLWFPMYLIFLTFTFLKLIYHHSDEGSSLSIFIIAIVIFLWFLTDFVLAVWPDVTFFLQEKPEEEQKYWVNVHCSFSNGFQMTEEELNVAWELGSNHKSESSFAFSLLIKWWWSWWWLWNDDDDYVYWIMMMMMMFMTTRAASLLHCFLEDDEDMEKGRWCFFCWFWSGRA